MELKYHKPHWQVPSHVGSIVTTRKGGFSEPPYASFNLGTHVGDEIDRVVKNRQQLLQDLKLQKGILFLNQIHSTKVVVANSKMLEDPPFDADALVTSEKQLALAIMTADCLPILLYNKEDIIANAHAGWRGLCNGIIENTIATMNADPTDTIAYLGPCIGAKHFEIGSEVRDQFLVQDPNCEDCFEAKSNDKYLANLHHLAKRRLVKIGVKEENIYVDQYCTYTNNDLFFSYRLERVTGRMATLIWLK